MRKTFIIGLVISQTVAAQNISQRLEDETKKMIRSENMLAANLSFYVADENGNVVYEYQGNKGLSTASTQKIFTAIAALDKLGPSFTFKTQASYSGQLQGSTLQGNFYLTSNGDPTLGSWRYEGYKPENFKAKLLAVVQDKGIKTIEGDLILDDSYFDLQTTPGGWPWNDMGNYYGAGVWGISWNENQFDMSVVGGKDIKSFNYTPVNVNWVSEVKAEGSGDNSIIYTAPFSDFGLINGRLPAGKTTVVSGALPNPPLVLGTEIKKWFSEKGITIKGKVLTYNTEKIKGNEIPQTPVNNVFFTYQSPSLDKIIYWFLQKSVNLYGETLVKTFSRQKTKNASFDSGINELKQYWRDKGLASAMINFADGSGLSPQNYVSAKAEVQALLYAQKQPWFDAFYKALPTYNGMKMKSGTIKVSKAYTGYHQSKSGKKYVFSMIVNNYSGGNINSLMYKVLDELK
ncbi:D-alanyl-D-alanine carboxypeptidase/D-alanyl-D-alanine endopeptidase [Elizabethkingia anophelis]|uniref:D-alanyl-D-alanine carboxypeptidase/D-alanyl-D-alanine endopeptidase n=1 Tax=Elizabethkingia anophelis TaxID=1117645 RepID=UPI00200C9090|nr:D-alanyl-D-alanine carboxypeptidase/D-alanyl-D-alanine-endopeptidase [Elizabethkingia anophelis]MCL1034192.1 D-alanyl-D-alanine carboxypeptidase/D-alanyl-D-alanine-endopeptidase [Elizabethkingia anophelis]